MGKVDDNKLSKRNALLKTAFDLFAEKGFAKTTISDLSLIHISEPTRH